MAPTGFGGMELHMRRCGRMHVSIRSTGLCCAAVVCLFAALFVPNVFSKGEMTARDSLKQGLLLLDRGGFEKALPRLEEAARQFGRAGEIKAQMEALGDAAEAYRALGRYEKALDRLNIAFSLAESLGDRRMTALILGSMGNASFFLGHTDKAWEQLHRGMGLARELGDPEGLAVLGRYTGKVHEMQGHYTEAISAYKKGMESAEAFGDPLLSAGIMADAASAFILTGDLTRAQALLPASSKRLEKLPHSHKKAYDLILIGQSYSRLSSLLPGKSAALKDKAYRTLQKAATTAEAIGDRRALSYAYGYTGKLYEGEGRYADGLEWTRRAIFAAQEIGARECLYLWEWQTGRLLKAMGRIKEAIAAYKNAVQSFQAIRGAASATCKNCARQDFQTRGGAIFFQLADLLLTYSGSLTDKSEIEPYLKEARNTIEMLKVVELEDYFADPCVTGSQTAKTRLEDIAEDALVVYTITFPDRLDLLLSGRHGIERITVPVDGETLRRETHLLRRTLAKRTTWQYLPHSRRIYDWIIRPLEPRIEKHHVKTLIFVPDGPLRTIPMAALHDGHDFIVQRMGVVTTPGLNLTDPRSIHRKENKVLLAGLSKGAQGFSPLLNVKQEIEGIGEIYEGKRLENEDFVSSNVKKALKTRPYPIVHIATHGQFAGDGAESFLLTWDDRIRMDQLGRFMKLSRFRKDPVELLTLSACQTAAGDERAALGLAGIAVRAGARSALATLWNVSDQAASILVVEFYRKLMDTAVSKADALQAAQLRLLDSERYRHPFYWSPYLLIGNWL